MHSSHSSNRNQETGANCSNVFGSQHKYGSSSQATMKPQCNTCQKFHFGGCRYKGKSRCGRCNLFGHNTNDCNDYKQLANCAQKEEEVSIANLFYACHVASIKDKVSPAEIEKEKHTEVAVIDLVAGENQNKKTIDATEVVHDEFKNEELAKQDKQQFKEGKEDTENCKPINLGEETTKESHQIYDLKAEKSHEDKMENEIQNEEVSNESREYLHQSAVKNETINGSFPDEALVKNAEDMGTKLQVGNHSYEKNSGYDRTEAITITNEEMDVEISQNEGSSDLVEASEATRDIHEEEETSKTTTEHIEEHVKEVEIEVDEHLSATKTTENTCSQKEATLLLCDNMSAISMARNPD